MALDLFDRRIDVTIYDVDYHEIGKVCTPSIGPKPEIKVEGNLISNTYAISSKVTITNIERSVPVEDAKWLYVSMYYGGASKADTIKKGFLFDVLYADQSKQPPDRQVCFNCLVAGTSPDIMQKKCVIGEVDAEGNPIEQTLDTLLRSVIVQYNNALPNDNLILKKQLHLAPEPLYRMAEVFAESYKNKKIAFHSSNSTLADVLDNLGAASLEKEKISEEQTVFVEYYALNFYVENNRLVVSTNPSEDHLLYAEKGIIDLSYVISAYRCGSIIHCSALFDPRIHQDAVIRIRRNAVLGRRVAGELLPLSMEIVNFRPVGGIKYVFSTTQENSMQMQGVAFADNSAIVSLG